MCVCCAKQVVVGCDGERDVGEKHFLVYSHPFYRGIRPITVHGNIFSS